MYTCYVVLCNIMKWSFHLICLFADDDFDFIKAMIMKEMIMIIVIFIIALCCSCSLVIMECSEGTEVVI